MNSSKRALLKSQQSQQKVKLQQEVDHLFSLIEEEGNEEPIKKILEVNPGLINVVATSSQFKGGSTALQWAVECGSHYIPLLMTYCAKIITDQNMKVSFKALIEYDAYEYEFTKEEMDAGIALLQSGANGRTLNSYSQNFLHFAVSHNPRVIPELIELGVSPHIPGCNSEVEVSLIDVFHYAYINKFIHLSDPTYRGIMLELFNSSYYIKPKDIQSVTKKLVASDSDYANYLALKQIDSEKLPETKSEILTLKHSYINYLNDRRANKAINHFVLIATALVYSVDEQSAFSVFPLEILTLIMNHLKIDHLPSNLLDTTKNKFAIFLNSQKNDVNTKSSTHKLSLFKNQLLKKIDEQSLKANSLSKK